jgi:uncharacterized phage protein (TIGR02218 family)
MPVTVSAQMTTLLESSASNLIKIVSVARRTKPTLYFTESPTDITYATNLYRADVGFQATSVSITAELNLQQTTLYALEGTDSATSITRSDILLGEYIDQVVVVQYINAETSGSEGSITIFKGVIGDHGLDDVGLIQLNCEGIITKTANVAGETYSPNCRNVLGDSLCGVDLDARKAIVTITEVRGAQTFGISVSSATQTIFESNSYREGVAQFSGGANDGYIIEISNITGGQLTCFLPPPLTVQVGDTVNLFPGCSKTISFCRTFYDNVRNFRGEPFSINPLKVEEKSSQSEATSTSAAQSAPVASSGGTSGFSGTPAFGKKR